jgi:predicted porin
MREQGTHPQRQTSLNFNPFRHQPPGLHLGGTEYQAKPNRFDIPSLGDHTMTSRIQLGLIGLSALLACTAQAQDSYKFSGTLDLGYYKDYDGEKKTGSISRSNVAFDANKDLGSGLSATGRINTRFFLRNPNTGENLVNEDPKYLGAGEATVGLKSNTWGQVRVGRALTALWNNDWAYDAWYNYDSIASPAWHLWHGNSAADPNASARNASFARLNNGVFYTSPTFGGGFSVDASFGTKTQDKDLNRSTSVALKYNQKDYGVMVAREKTPAGNTISFLSGKMNFGKLSVMAAYDDEKLVAGNKNRSYSASARYTDGAMSYMLGAGIQRDYDNAKFFSAGASYAFKPNMNLYVSYGNKGAGLWGSTSSANALGVGVSYSF